MTSTRGRRSTRAAARAPAERLAERIADTIRGWLDNGEMLASEGRRITAGDILILVRKRRPFAGPMVAALKARGIDVAGADRLRLSDQIAVADLVSLGEFLTLPEDDLSLAEVLKSPLIGFDDNDLLTLAAGRKGTLWKSLIDHAGDNPRFQGATETLKRWRSRADFVPPFEFFASILDREGGRAKLLARLGPEAADPIDEFLNLALSYDDNAPPSLTGFLTYLREADREVKRDMEHGRNEVRVMTVHGAKGLEAPIVFLPDTCSTATGGPVATLFDLEDLGLPEGADGKPFVWSVKGTSGHRVITAAKQERVGQETEERNRLLYVAMTRARDRLYIAGFEGKNGQSAGCWYELISGALGNTLSEAAGHDGSKVLRRLEPQTAAPKAREGAATTGRRRRLAAAVGDAARRRASRRCPFRSPRRVSKPTRPTRAASRSPTAPSRQRPPNEEPPALPPAAQSTDHRFLRGTLTHALLQHLPTLPASGWPKAAAGYLEARGSALPPAARKRRRRRDAGHLAEPGVRAPVRAAEPGRGADRRAYPQPEAQGTAAEAHWPARSARRPRRSKCSSSTTRPTGRRRPRSSRLQRLTFSSSRRIASRCAKYMQAGPLRRRCCGRTARESCPFPTRCSTNTPPASGIST